MATWFEVWPRSLKLEVETVVRNWTRKSKFEPNFSSNPYVVLERNEEAKNLLLMDISSSKVILRHLDDVKDFIIQKEKTPADTETSVNSPTPLQPELIAQ